MFKKFQLVLLLLLIPTIFSESCEQQVNDCFNRLRTDLENHKKLQFTDPENGVNNICHENDGIFTKFVHCIGLTERLCASGNNFKSMVCETRKLRLRISRYQWRANMFYEMCRNTSSTISKGIIEHEECISGVLNARNWLCDENYDKPRKQLDWKREHEQSCSLWKKFRDCSKQDVKQKCGTNAADISDYLFHSHHSYFDKYNACNLEEDTRTECWYDTLKSQISTATTEATQTVTHTTTQYLSTDQIPLVINTSTHDSALQITTSESTISSAIVSQSQSHHDSSSQTITIVPESFNLTESIANLSSVVVVVNDTLSDDDNQMSRDSHIKAEIAKYKTVHNNNDSVIEHNEHESDTVHHNTDVNILQRDNLKSDLNHNHNDNQSNNYSNPTKFNFLLLIFIIYVAVIVVIF